MFRKGSCWESNKARRLLVSQKTGRANRAEHLQILMMLPVASIVWSSVVYSDHRAERSLSNLSFHPHPKHHVKLHFSGLVLIRPKIHTLKHHGCYSSGILACISASNYMRTFFVDAKTAKKPLFGPYLCSKNCVIIKVSKMETLCEFWYCENRICQSFDKWPKFRPSNKCFEAGGLQEDF